MEYMKTLKKINKKNPEPLKWMHGWFTKPFLLGAANGLLKNLGLAKFLLNFKGPAVSFFEQILVSESRIFCKSVSKSRFLKYLV